MDRSSDATDYQVLMATRQWLIVDAVIDNEVSTEAQDGDPGNVVDLGNSVRRAGWAQNPGWPRDLKGFGTWPAPGQESPMALSGAQWGLVLSVLDQWSAVAAGLGDLESADRAEEERAIAALIRVQLAEQGCSTA
ncbi:hypothetical protein GCM10010402_08180 [Actinomadura luteofluorescens]|uniref:hypothetical protein n=1 Tax=Actinomadura luteofluorescens TaxID=46163 RepID=UPI00216418BD|nr:hypothetical protein [Actinomadura glauciflava]MCR3738373.1 hypothetical protein [Actinomadura glauciflava]